jgi:hypothetical protein
VAPIPRKERLLNRDCQSKPPVNRVASRILFFILAVIACFQPAFSRSGNAYLGYINVSGLSYAELQLGAIQFGDWGWGPRESVALGVGASHAMLGLQTAYSDQFLNAGVDVLVGKTYGFNHYLGRDEAYYGAQVQCDVLLFVSLRAGWMRSFSGSQGIHFSVGLGLNGTALGNWRVAHKSQPHPHVAKSILDKTNPTKTISAKHRPSPT